jgi:DNA-binding SARP family transcriptional activator/tetratricopeptide (TPR) repeat protein
MEFRTLGELEVWHADSPVPVRGAVQRSVLALLLLRANEVVRTEDLVEELWGAEAPHTAPKMIQNAVSNLRKNGLAEVLATRAGGYTLQIDPEQVDATRFERLVERARESLAAGMPEVSEQLLEQANALWRGAPLADLAPEAFAQREIARLEELRLRATECSIESGLALGRHRELTGTLETLVNRHPLRETLRMQLMLSLYRSGRQADALAAYQAARAYLRDEVGLEPGPALQRLEQAILIQDPVLDPFLDTSAAEPRAVRKTLTVLHADLERRGRELDPEALLSLSGRAVKCLADAVTSHGGTVTSASDVTFVAVFGLPTLAEDDPLRAARAALGIRDTLAELNESLERQWGVRYEVRVGVATGKTLVDPGDTTTAAGEVFSLAARLARHADADEVRLATPTRTALRAAVDVERAEETDDRQDPGWRLLEVRQVAAIVPRRLDAPLIGRQWELAQLRHAFDRAARGHTSYLITVLGPAGIGKSRLAHEFALSVADQATVLTGRCPSYGAGVTYWPLAEIVREAAGATTRNAIASLLADEPDADGIAATIAGAIGADEQAGGSANDLFWAVGSLLTALSRDRPLVVVFDDLQWAEPRLLDLLEHLVDATRDSPVLLLCLARSELLDLRTSWGGGKLNASTILLEPLSGEECRLLIEHAAGGALDPVLAGRLTAAAEGNPLFLEQMIAIALEEGVNASELPVPPTIEALLAARLDRLEPLERTLLERASVVGKEFSLSEVTALSPEPEQDLRRRLDLLTRRELLAPAAAPRRGDAGYRFRHGLMRDAAYDAIPKTERAELHEGLARFLKEMPEHLRGREEVLGFHLEQAYRYRVELGQAAEDVHELADEARVLLAGAGRRAYARDDVPAAVSLLGRAADLAGSGTSARLELLPDLGEAVREGGDYPRAEAVLAEAINAAGEAGDGALEEYARLVRLRMRVQTDSELDAELVVDGARRALDAFSAVDDARSLAKAWELLAWGHWLECHAAATEEALAHSLEHARRASDARTTAQSLHLTVGAAVFGPRPVPDAIARCEEILQDGRQKRVTASALRALAALKAMAGEFDEARWLLGRFAAIVEDLGLRVTAASAAETYAEVELLAGEPAAAEARLRPAYSELVAMGETSTSVNLAALLAQALHAQGRDEEAAAVSDVSLQEDDVSAHVHLFTARARALAAIGRREEAERLAENAVELARKTDFLVMHGEALTALAEVLRENGSPAEARALLNEALELFRAKQHLVSSKRTEDLLTKLVSDA